ncbi:MAG: hypothetical protein ACRBCI_14050 [Cellvibrionaceae bacterium]
MKFIILGVFLLFSSVSYADGTYTGKITIIQSGHKPTIQISSDTYIMVTLDPIPDIDSSCGTGNRLLLDAGTEWGKILTSHLLSAQARGQSVTIGTIGCVSQSSSSKSWELINWVRSN